MTERCQPHPPSPMAKRAQSHQLAGHLMDNIDQRIIGLLAEDGRMSVTKIASEIGRSRVATQNRIDAMLRDGEIQGFSIRLKSRPISALFEVRLHPKQRCEQMLPRLRQHYAFKHAWSVTGDSDLFIWVEVDQMQTLQDIQSFLVQQAEVAQAATHTVVKHHA